MTARILDGKALAATLLDELQQEVARLAESGTTPGLAIVDASGDPAAQQYLNRKRKRAQQIGLHVEVFPFDPATPQAELLGLIARLNETANIHGIIVEQPFAPHIDAQEVWAAIAPEKDVDGSNPFSQGLLAQGMPALVPATALSVVTLLERCDIPIAGRDAVVVGRSAVVGRPVTLLLLQRNATVTVCHSHTSDLAAHTRRAEILVVAAGRAGLIGGDMIRPGAAVIDVGTNVQAGRTVGDVRREEALAVAGALAPVPGGVGPVTTALLLQNTVASARRLAVAQGAALRTAPTATRAAQHGSEVPR